MIIKQPDGKYAIWSTIVDDFIYIDCTKEEWIEMRKKEECDRIEKDLNDIFDYFEKNEIPKFYPKIKYEEILTLYKTKQNEL